MSNLKIGQVVQHDGKIYQILKISESVVTAYSYGENCEISETIFVSKKSGNVIARSPRRIKILKGN